MKPKITAIIPLGEKRSIEVFQHKNLNEISNPHLANNIINGITLNNYIEVFK